MSIRITVDRTRCIGAGTCAVAAPATFYLDPEHRAAVRTPPGDRIDDLRLAAESCPLAAIRLEHVEDAAEGDSSRGGAPPAGR